MSIRLAISFYFLIAVIFIIEGFSLEAAPLLDHQPVPKKLEYLMIGIGLAVLINTLFLMRRKQWALPIARLIAGVCCVGLLNLMFHIRALDLFCFLVCSLWVALIWVSVVLKKHGPAFVRG